MIFCNRLLHKKDFITSNEYENVSPGLNSYVFDIKHHQNFSSAQPVKVMFDFRPAVPTATNLIGSALLLTNKNYQFLMMVNGNMI